MHDSIRIYQFVFTHPKVLQAWELAAQLHRGDHHGEQAYISHLHEVAEMLFFSYPNRQDIYEGGKVANDACMSRLIDEICAGFLHDIIEDHGDHITLGGIRKQFGDRVAKIVELCSDIDIKAPPLARTAENWRQRKQGYLDKLASKIDHLDDPDIVSYLRVSCADKYVNTEATLERHRDWFLAGKGAAFWERFKATMSDRLWYDNRLSEIYLDILHAAPEAVRPQLEWLVTELKTVTDGINMRTGYEPESLQAAALGLRAEQPRTSIVA